MKGKSEKHREIILLYSYPRFIYFKQALPQFEPRCESSERTAVPPPRNYIVINFIITDVKKTHDTY